ncbi:MAG: inositol monophosphatase family protein [Synechococcales bacterium]|nr:inositol monophosphatase family protein [Synechococcales bacterium]
MVQSIPPRQILATLLPYLKVAATYAQQIQSRIASRPDKTEYDNIFGSALSDADLSVQTLVEVALLGSFPHLRFYGEEFEQSYNTKYFRAIDLGEQDDYLVTLDPIDGTRFYLDGHGNYMVILTVLNRDEYEAAIALAPATRTYYYALRGKGAFVGSFDQDLDACQPLPLNADSTAIYLGRAQAELVSTLKQISDRYQVISLTTDYSAEVQVPNHTGVISGDLGGSVLTTAKFIDGAAIAFIAQEAGAWVTTWEGAPPPPLFACENYERPGLVIATNPAIHQDLLKAVQACH